MIIMIELRSTLLLGNQAIALAALASGVSVAAGYPGTPSTEIIETLMEYKDIYVEWSTNEKVAFETAYGAAISGARAMACMKHVGVNVASDSLVSSSYTGVDGALVIVSAGDPGMWSSQNEQDNRYYGLMALIPILEPYDPQSAHDFTVKAFEISSRVGHPVILNTTTRVSHVRAPVKTLPRSSPVKGSLRKRPDRYSLVPDVARRDRDLQLERWEKIKEELESLVVVSGSGRKAIVASGISYPYVKEVLEDWRLQDEVKLIGLFSPVPLPDKVGRELMDVEEVLVVEELEPIVENQLKSFVVDEGLHIRVQGKKLTGRSGEMTLNRVRLAISKFMGLNSEVLERHLKPNVPPRPPAMCPGCPHRSSFVFMKRGVILGGMKETFYSGDIGCYSLGVLPPFNVQDSLISMGSSIGIANGVYRSTGTIPVAVIGDSTFFHAGLSSLANAVYNNTPLLVVVLDNRSTAMTGQQPSPSENMDIARVAAGLGVEYVSVADPFSTDFSKAVANAISWVKVNKKPALLIAKRACALKAVEGFSERPLAFVNEDKCTGCTICYDHFTCPAIMRKANKKAHIDPRECIGCGACVPICPFNAILLKGEKPEGWDRAWLS
jgi:Indolepyruvate ferredoxin oxidoreductase, alpha and beta subunits